MPEQKNPAAPDFAASEEQIRQVRELGRARTRLMVCFWTLPVYVVAIWILLNNQKDIEVLMYIYMGLWAGFAVDMARRNCPVCHQQYFVKNILLSLRKKSCTHCGFPLSQGDINKKKDEVTF